MLIVVTRIDARRYSTVVERDGFGFAPEAAVEKRLACDHHDDTDHLHLEREAQWVEVSNLP